MPQLASFSQCTGCQACVNACPRGAISMTNGEGGFLYPHIDEQLCVNCGLCEKACPIISEDLPRNFDKPKTYAFWSEIDRTVSSSGGAFSSFARLVLKKEGVVFGAVLDNDLSCHHVEIDSIDRLDLLRGSKYVQSSIGDTFRKAKFYLKKDRWVLFSGTPCQIAGLYSYLGSSYDKLLTLDIVCHGVPSNEFFRAYIKKLETKLNKGTINGFMFRDLSGWGYSPAALINNTFYPVYGVDSLYMEAFEKKAICRKSCYSCRFATFPRVGDCTIADFWGIGRHGKPFKHDVMKGVSLVLINNEKGTIAFDELDACFKEERNLEEALIENGNLNNPNTFYLKRDKLITAFLDKNKTLDSIEYEFHLVNRTLKGYIKRYSYKLGLFGLMKNLYNFYMRK